MSAGAPTRQPGIKVVLVGVESPILDELSVALERQGWATARLAAAADAPLHVGPHHKAVFVVHAPEADQALEVLQRLDEKRHSVLVIVLIDHAEPGEYYCLMEAGAVQCFEIREDTERILRGVEWAAHVLAP